MSRFTYNKINERIPNFIKPLKISIRTHVPNPNDTDYKRGFILRYFLQKVNDTNGPVYEVSDTTFANFLNNELYLKCKIEWKISGTNDEIKKVNLQTLLEVNNKMPALKKYLSNLLQFSKNNLGI